MTPKLIFEGGWALGPRWDVCLLMDGVVMVTYDHCASFLWEGGPAPLRDAVAKALMKPIDPIPLGEGWELEGHKSGITLHTPHCRFDLPEGPAKCLLWVLREVCNAQSLKGGEACPPK